ncbi:hypothetical protein [Actinoplanes sp. NPDC051494]
MAVLGTAGDRPIDQVVAGQALQRVLLTATADGRSARRPLDQVVTA